MDDYTKWHQSQPDIGLDEAIERIEGRMKAMLIMDMPKTCDGCPLCIPQNGYCAVGGKARKVDLETGKADWGGPDYDCPLIPARGYIDAHGNLISWEDESDG